MPKMSLLENEVPAALSKDLDFEVQRIRGEYGCRQDRLHEARSFSAFHHDWAQQKEAP
jgi:hypothetical protein